MSELDSRVTLLVSSFDGYSMCWDPFIHGLKKYFPRHPPLRFITNHKDVPYGQAIKVGEDRGWSRNLRYALSQIDTPLVLYAQEDYWLTQPVDDACFAAHVDRMARGDAVYIRMKPTPGPPEALPDDPTVGYLPVGAGYRTSLQMALWRKDVLDSLIVDTESAWDFERHSIARSAPHRGFMCVTKRKYGIEYLFTAIVAGEWRDGAYDYARSEGVHVDFGALRKRPLLQRVKRRIKSRLVRARKLIAGA